MKCLACGHESCNSAEGDKEYCPCNCAGVAELVNEKDEAYIDRNLLVIALAHALNDAGFPTWTGDDIEAPDWPLVYVELPTGQISYHVPKALLEKFGLPKYAPNAVAPLGKWDGHTVEDKRRRLLRFLGVGP